PCIESYKAYETYFVRVIQCSFVIGLNYLDMECPEKAIPHFKRALEKAKKVDIDRLQGVSLYNLGLSFYTKDDFEKAVDLFTQSLKIY
ncbi:tetratricopeptide repeat protein, partial [Bacillus atrophaeus]|uniref:tetratricopeptide repeat protein n=1 Tax=Bacillus atrophaeus TaxID=1452 RepID=UPI002282EB5B